jgi:DNA-binding NarL/FixJ family response regulator
MIKTRILIAEDSPEIQNYFKNIIMKETDMQLVGVAGNGVEVVDMANRLNPDIILMDIQMETKTAGIDATEKIKKMNPEIKVIVLTIHSRDDYLYRAYAAGTMDYIIKTSSVEQILASIRSVAANRLMLRPEIANKIIAECKRVQEFKNKMQDVLKVMMKITNTEFEIIRLVYDGYTYKNIAEERYVEETTIRSEIYWILKKFNKKKMKEVIALLKEMNFFDFFNIE